MISFKLLDFIFPIYWDKNMSIQTFFVFSFCCSMREGYPCNWRGFCDYYPGGAKLSQADFFRRILMLRFWRYYSNHGPGDCAGFLRGAEMVSPGLGEDPRGWGMFPTPAYTVLYSHGTPATSSASPPGKPCDVILTSHI